MRYVSVVYGGRGLESPSSVVGGGREWGVDEGATRYA
jgi:hypothetical protein